MRPLPNGAEMSLWPRLSFLLVKSPYQKINCGNNPLSCLFVMSVKSIQSPIDESLIFLLLSGDLLFHQDKLLDKHIAEDTFGEEQLQDIGRPVKSLVVWHFPILLANLCIFWFYLYIK